MSSGEVLQLMGVFATLGGLGVGITGAVFGVVLKMDRRLTRIETHLKIESEK